MRNKSITFLAQLCYNGYVASISKGVFCLSATRTEGRFPSSTGQGDVYYRVFKPSTPAKAAVQVLHDVAEHGERYTAFAEQLCNAGYEAWVCDLPGHGRSSLEENLGFFSTYNGWKKVLADLRRFTEIIRSDAELPVFLFGQGMGSLFARAICSRTCNEYIGAIFAGTSTSSPAGGVSRLVAQLVVLVHGEKHRSTLLQTVAFGHYNQRFPKRTSADWLTSDPDAVRAYLGDPLCAFPLTARGTLDYFSLLAAVNHPKWFRQLHYQFPVLCISGEDDAVGDFGKGVELVGKRLREAGCNRVQTALLPQMRHAILHEQESTQAIAVVIDWLQATLQSQEA